WPAHRYTIAVEDQRVTDLVLEVGVEIGTAKDEVPMLPNSTQFVARTGFCLEIGIADDDPAGTGRAIGAAAAAGRHCVSGSDLPNVWCAKAGGDAALDRQVLCGVPDTVDPRRDIFAIDLMVIETHACRQRKIVGQTPFIF